MEITADVVTQFRANYPYYSDATKYPEATINLALSYSDEETGSNGWGSYLDNPRNLKQSGMFSWSAHWLYITYPNGAQDSENMSPVAANTVVSKSVGDESISFAVYTPSSAKDMSESWYTQTKWGQQFLQLKKRAYTKAAWITV